MSGWHERLHTDPAGLEAAIARVRADAEAVSATQFETLTAAAFLDFKERGVKSAAIEAGLGGRHDATNVIDARVVLLTNVGLEHTEVLGSTREAIAAEKLAVARPGATVVLPDDEFARARPPARTCGSAARGGGGGVSRSAGRTRRRLAARPARAFADARCETEHTLPRRRTGCSSGCPEPGGYVVVASILEDKDAAGILVRLAGAGDTLVATRSSNDRALPAAALAERGRAAFARVTQFDDPGEALDYARGLGRPVLVTGSLYLLADLAGKP